MSETSLSRRALFGTGLRHALDRRLSDLEQAPGGPSRTSAARDGLSVRLGHRLRPVAEAMVELGGVRRGNAVLALAAGSDVLQAVATERGADVTAMEDLPAGAAEASFDVVLAFFSATAHPSPRLVASELARVARRGAPIVLAAWPGTAWARYETAYRHFFGFADLDVLDRELHDETGGYSLVFCRKP